MIMFWKLILVFVASFELSLSSYCLTTAASIIDTYFLNPFLTVSGVALPLYSVWIVIGVLLILVIILAIRLCVKK